MRINVVAISLYDGEPLMDNINVIMAEISAVMDNIADTVVNHFINPGRAVFV